MKKFHYVSSIISCLCIIITIFIISCGNDSFYSEGPTIVQVSSFYVKGNDTPVNGREQVVAGINSGSFQIGLNIDPDWADDALILVSDQEDLASTNLEQEIAFIECKYYPFCNFQIVLNCNFNLSNQISCQAGSLGGGPIQAALPQADISPLLSGNQADLFVVFIGSANGAESTQRSVPVTFRHN